MWSPSCAQSDAVSADPRGAHTSKKHPLHKIWPYLLRNIVIDRPNQVWRAKITYLQVRRGVLYLVAIMD
jgi:putative transposase